MAVWLVLIKKTTEIKMTKILIKIIMIDNTLSNKNPSTHQYFYCNYSDHHSRLDLKSADRIE